MGREERRRGRRRWRVIQPPTVEIRSRAVGSGLRPLDLRAKEGRGGTPPVRPPSLSELMPVTPVRPPPPRICKRERVRDGSTMDLREKERGGHTSSAGSRGAQVAGGRKLRRRGAPVAGGVQDGVWDGWRRHRGERDGWHRCCGERDGGAARRGGEGMAAEGERESGGGRRAAALGTGRVPVG